MWREAGAPVRSKRKADLRVLLTCDCVGGVWTYALDLAGGLAKAGVAVILAVLGPPPGAAQVEEATTHGVDLVALDVPLDWTAADASQLRLSGLAVAKLAAERRVDLVHLHLPALAADVSYPVPVLVTAHSCVATWWAAVRTGPLPPDLAWRAELVGQGCRRVDALCAPSLSFAQATASAYRLPALPTVIHNGRAPAPPAQACDAAPREPFVFTAGRLWDEGKNAAALDRAAAQLPGQVVAAGTTAGPNGAAVDLPSLRHLGQIRSAEIAAWLVHKPVFASTALYEPFGLSVLEAAQAGCALVLSDIPTFRELWSEAAVYVDPHDDEALAQTLAGLLSRPKERQRLGEAARLQGRRYGLDTMVRSTLARYRTLGGRTCPSAPAGTTGPVLRGVA